MRTTAMATSSDLEHLKSSVSGVSGSHVGLMKRFIRAVETSDWDEDILRQEKWLNGICLAIIAMAVLYLGPILLFSLWG